MSQLDDIYTREWYEHDFEGLQPEFNLVADGLTRWWSPRKSAKRANTSWLDVGCGPGMLVKALRIHGWDARGIDGSKHALDYARQHVGPDAMVAQFDILEHGGRWASSHDDMVVCTEVAEHIEAEHAPFLVKTLTTIARCRIVLTAAPPGQDGHHHVNCQPREYWLDLFADHGWIEDVESTREIKQRWSKLKRLSHMTRNVIVMR